MKLAGCALVPPKLVECEATHVFSGGIDYEWHGQQKFVLECEKLGGRSEDKSLLGKIQRFNYWITVHSPNMFQIQFDKKLN